MAPTNDQLAAAFDELAQRLEDERLMSAQSDVKPLAPRAIDRPIQPTSQTVSPAWSAAKWLATAVALMIAAAVLISALDYFLTAEPSGCMTSEEVAGTCVP